MGQKANENEINFNYPIPRRLHMDVKMLSLKNRMSVKDIVICALREYVDMHLGDSDVDGASSGVDDFSFEEDL